MLKANSCSDEKPKILVLCCGNVGISSLIHAQTQNIELVSINKPPSIGKTEDDIRKLPYKELILHLKEISLTQREFNYKPPKKNFVNKFNKNQHRK